MALHDYVPLCRGRMRCDPIRLRFPFAGKRKVNIWRCAAACILLATIFVCNYVTIGLAAKLGTARDANHEHILISASATESMGAARRGLTQTGAISLGIVVLSACQCFYRWLRFRNSRFLLAIRPLPFKRIASQSHPSHHGHPHPRP